MKRIIKLMFLVAGFTCCIMSESSLKAAAEPITTLPQELIKPADELVAAIYNDQADEVDKLYEANFSPRISFDRPAQSLDIVKALDTYVKNGLADFAAPEMINNSAGQMFSTLIQSAGEGLKAIVSRIQKPAAAPIPPAAISTPPQKPLPLRPIKPREEIIPARAITTVEKIYADIARNLIGGNISAATNRVYDLIALHKQSYDEIIRNTNKALLKIDPERATNTLSSKEYNQFLKYVSDQTGLPAAEPTRRPAEEIRITPQQQLNSILQGLKIAQQVLSNDTTASRLIPIVAKKASAAYGEISAPRRGMLSPQTTASIREAQKALNNFADLSPVVIAYYASEMEKLGKTLVISDYESVADALGQFKVPAAVKAMQGAPVTEETIRQVAELLTRTEAPARPAEIKPAEAVRECPADVQRMINEHIELLSNAQNALATGQPPESLGFGSWQELLGAIKHPLIDLLINSATSDQKAKIENLTTRLLDMLQQARPVAPAAAAIPQREPPQPRRRLRPEQMQLQLPGK